MVRQVALYADQKATAPVFDASPAVHRTMVESIRSIAIIVLLPRPTRGSKCRMSPPHTLPLR